MCIALLAVIANMIYNFAMINMLQPFKTTVLFCACCLYYVCDAILIAHVITLWVKLLAYDASLMITG